MNFLFVTILLCTGPNELDLTCERKNPKWINDSQIKEMTDVHSQVCRTSKWDKKCESATVCQLRLGKDEVITVEESCWRIVEKNIGSR